MIAYMRAWCLATVLVSAATLQAADQAPLDYKEQTSMFKRILSYDRSLRQSERVVVLVVARSKASAAAEKAATAFRESEMYPAVVTVGGLNDDLTAALSPGSTVIYVMPDVDVTKVKDFAALKGFLTLSGVPSHADEGYVSVSVEVENDRPKIVVNLPRLEEERHQLAAELLGLARVIRAPTTSP